MAQANQTQIPVIQTGDTATQIQQNVNKVIRNAINQLVTLQNATSLIQAVGDIILSPLTLAQFQATHGNTWIIANGQSSVGTAYQALTLNQVVPSITVTNATAFIKVN